MSFTYTYTHVVPTVFVDLQVDGHTWMPNTGDKITLDRAMQHPYLELVDHEVPSKTTITAPLVASNEPTTTSAVVDGNNDTKE